ncbi:MAG: hypothetical protein GC193_13890 [Cryomorphaceae bacterium]|nr:hypothetical protein [Cryomorphaceae bacterium]
MFIDAADLPILISSFGCTSNCGVADMNNDGSVNAADLLILLGQLGLSYG